MSTRRERDLKELAQLEKQKRALERRIQTLRGRLIRTAHYGSDTETAVVDALQSFGALSFLELVKTTGRNRNTMKTALRNMKAGGRVIHDDGKYSL